MSAIRIKLYLCQPFNEIRRFVINSSTSLQEFHATLLKLVADLNTNDIHILYLDDEKDWVRFTTEQEWQEALKVASGNNYVLRIKIVKPKSCQQESLSACSQPKECKEEKKQERCFRNGGGCPWWKRRYQRQEASSEQQQQQQPQNECPAFNSSCGGWMKMAQQFLPQLFNGQQSIDPQQIANLAQQFLPQFLNAQQQQQGPAVHQHVVCDGCDERGIRGTRYKCNQCPDYDLCAQCHNGRNEIHDPSHSFTAIENPMQGWINHFLNNISANQPKQQEEKKEEKSCSEQPSAPAPAPTVEKEDEPAADLIEIEVEQQQPVVQQEEVKKPVEEVKPVEQVSPYEKEIKTLEAMGFSNRKLVEHLLNNYKGNIQRVVEALLAVHN
jgi:hypothetical protein